MMVESLYEEVTEDLYASPSTSTKCHFVQSPTPIFTSAHSAVVQIMEPALDNASRSFFSDSTSSDSLTAHFLSLSLHELVENLAFSSNLIINDRLPYFDNLCLESSPHDFDPNYSRIKTPYQADAFHVYLSKANIFDRYPELCFKLTYGFPIGKLADLHASFTPGNLTSATPDWQVIQEYITDELKIGRLSGPFTKYQLEAKIGSFRSSPIQVVVKPGDPGEPDKYRCCRNLSYRGKLGFSVNDDINSDEYPTRWGTVVECAKIVSCISVESHSIYYLVRVFNCPIYIMAVFRLDSDALCGGVHNFSCLKGANVFPEYSLYSVLLDCYLLGGI